MKTGFSLKKEIKNLHVSIKSLEFKIVFIFISFSIIQIISYYQASKRFFRFNLFDFFVDSGNVFFIEYAYWLVSEWFLQFIIPVLLIIFVLKDKPKNFGVQWGDKKIGFSFTVIFLLVMLPVLWIVSGFPNFQNTYPQCQEVRENWLLFFIYEFCFLLYMMGWEFSLRGYLLFGLKEKFGNYAILIQMIPFVILHNGKPQLETYGSVIAGLALGILALRTGSYFYGVIIHASVMFFIDLISIIRYKTQVFGMGIDSMIDIFRKL